MTKNSKFLILASIIMLVFMFQSCEKDIYEEQIYQSKFKISYVNSIALDNNNLLMQKINKTTLFKKNSLNRIITDTVTGISIDTDKVKYIVGEDFNSYTFKIIKPDQTLLDNLVLISKNGGEYKAYGMRYTLSDEEKLRLDTQEYIDFTNKCKAVEIEDSNSLEEILSKFNFSEQCDLIYVWEEVISIVACTIDGCFSAPWATISYAHILVATRVCSSGGNNNAEGSSEIGTSPHGGGNAGNDVVDNPCLTLKKHLSATVGVKLKSPTMVPALQDLLNQPLENGKSLIKTNAVYSTLDAPVGTDSKIIVKYGGTIFGSIHLHPYPSGAPMFSWSDVYSLVLFYNFADYDILSEVVIYLVCKDGNGVNQLYALKIDNPDVFSDALIADINTTVIPSELEDIAESEKTKEIIKLMDYQMKLDLQRSPDKELGFLKKFSNFGISLYKANTTMTNWSKLTLQNPNSQNPTVLPVPCN